MSCGSFWRYLRVEREKHTWSEYSYSPERVILSTLERLGERAEPVELSECSHCHTHLHSEAGTKSYILDEASHEQQATCPTSQPKLY